MTIAWEKLESETRGVADIYRTKVPGGWLVTAHGGGIMFVPDPNHKWK